MKADANDPEILEFEELVEGDHRKVFQDPYAVE
jgi:hypothetical protein